MWKKLEWLLHCHEFHNWNKGKQMSCQQCCTRPGQTRGSQGLQSDPGSDPGQWSLRSQPMELWGLQWSHDGIMDLIVMGYLYWQVQPWRCFGIESIEQSGLSDAANWPIWLLETVGQTWVHEVGPSDLGPSDLFGPGPCNTAYNNKLKFHQPLHALYKLLEL